MNQAVSQNAGSTKLRACVSAALVLICVSIYAQTLWHGFVTFDDPDYITLNPPVKAGLTLHGLAWAFTTTHASNWHPLTWLSHMTDCQIFGLNPWGHHLTNLLLHSLNAVALFLVLDRMTSNLWPSALVAALFAAHPLHVESVAWIAERKDLLSACFGFMALGAYTRYCRRPSVSSYAWVFAAMALSLMSKAMLVTLPCLLLLLDYWPFGRYKNLTSARAVSRRMLRLTLEKAPLFLLTVASCVITYRAQSGAGATAFGHSIPLGARLSNAAVACVVYLGKTVYPVYLAAFYPHPYPSHPRPLWLIAGAVLILIAATAAATASLRKAPYCFVGWFWYLGTLVPTLGIVQVGGQAYADRYTYVPLTGLFIALAWGLKRIARVRRNLRRPIVCGAALMVGVFTCVATVQTSYWRNDYTLWTHAIRVTSYNNTAHNNLGLFFERHGRLNEAIAQFRESARIQPILPEAYNNLGVIFQKQGKIPLAEAEFSEAIRRMPDYALGQSNLGTLLAEQGHYAQALPHLLKAVRLDPDNADAHSNLGQLYAILGKVSSAAVQYRQAVRLNPNDMAARRFLTKLDKAPHAQH